MDDLKDLKEFSLGMNTQLPEFKQSHRAKQNFEQISEMPREKFVASTASFDSLLNKDFGSNSDDSLNDNLEENSYAEGDTEKDEIAIITSQMEKIQQLESKLLDYSHHIDHLEIKAKQTELYKQQNDNFKQQIEAFETKLKLEENDKK